MGNINKMNLDKLQQQYNSYLKTDSYLAVPKSERQGSNANQPTGLNLIADTNVDESLGQLKAKLSKKKAELKPKATTNPVKLNKKIKKAKKASSAKKSNKKPKQSSNKKGCAKKNAKKGKK